ncbi:MAG: phytanoyl-CoA dioxygenase family protein, partial [Gammaproteobacteria bacterium]|nr:phytanoyl-CoA dioxygenase family protein [Gammaproteobacteria bacterium]
MNEQNALPINGAEISRRFSEDGYYFPIIAFSEQEAAFDVEQLHSLESRNQGRPLGNKGQINLPHVIFRFADDIVRNSRILDAVEAIIGPDILVWGSTFFIKEPHSETYISWHQDLRYWGLDGDAEVSAWVALSPVTVANGCMRFLPGSHKGEMLPHRDTFSEDNFLTRGQEAEIEIDETDTINVLLRPG